MTPEEINKFKEDLRNEAKDFSRLKITGYMMFIRILMVFLNPVGLWTIDIVMWFVFPFLFNLAGLLDFTLLTILFFLICHFIYWEFIGKKQAKELIDDLSAIGGKPGLKIMYDSLKEIKINKKNEYNK